MRLRPGVKWHDRAPISGRAVDVADVTSAFDRFAAKGAIRGLFINSVNPQAPLVSMKSTDARTVVVKLSEPVTYALEMLASFGSLTGDIIMVPKETDGTFDIRRDMIGTGPYTLDKYTPSQSFTYKRNEAYFDKDFTNYDGVTMPIISEYAAQLAQFKAGNIHYFTPNNEDVVTIKKEDSRILLYATDFTPNINCLTFGKLPDGTSNPGAPSPTLAFIGPLAGSLARPVGGWLSDKFGGARVTISPNLFGARLARRTGSSVTLVSFELRFAFVQRLQTQLPTMQLNRELIDVTRNFSALRFIFFQFPLTFVDVFD